MQKNPMLRRVMEEPIEAPERVAQVQRLTIMPDVLKAKAASRFRDHPLTNWVIFSSGAPDFVSPTYIVDRHEAIGQDLIPLLKLK